MPQPPGGGRPGGWPPRLALSAEGALATPVGPASVALRRPLPRVARRLRTHPRAMPYQRLAVAVVLANAAVVWLHVSREDWGIADGTALSALSGLTLVNLTAAVLIRQQHVLNVLFGLAGRGSRAWPLWLRWSISKVHHVGGIHVGAALAATGWLCALTAAANVARIREPAAVSLTTVVVHDALAALAVLICICAAPAVRARAHNVFECSHRFGGWTAIALFWVLTVHLAVTGRGSGSALAALVTDWHAWVLAVLTASVAWPWLRLRRVPVTVKRPSRHAAIVRSTTASRQPPPRRSRSAAAPCASGTRSRR